MRLKRQKSGAHRYWIIVSSKGKYLGSLGSVSSLGDPPQVTREALEEFARKRRLDPEALAAIQGLRVLSEGASQVGKPESDERGSLCSVPTVRVRFVGRGSYLLNGVALFRPGDVKEIPRCTWEEKFRENPAFERA